MGEPAVYHGRGTGADVFVELSPKGLLPLKFSILMHQQFEQPGAVKAEIRKLFFFQGRGERMTKKQKEKAKCWGKDRAQEAKSWS